MTLKITLILVIAFSITAVHSENCFNEKISCSCRSKYIDNNNCCFDSTCTSNYCCDEEDFDELSHKIEKSDFTFGPTIIIIVGISFLCCISLCLYCFCHKKRHRGVIHGTVHTGVQQIPVPNPPATYAINNNVQPPNPINQPPNIVNQPPYMVNQPPNMVNQPQCTIDENESAETFQKQPPPSYSAAVLAPQEPYNPAYLNYRTSPTC